MNYCSFSNFSLSPKESTPSPAWALLSEMQGFCAPSAVTEPQRDWRWYSWVPPLKELSVQGGWAVQRRRDALPWLRQTESEGRRWRSRGSCFLSCRNPGEKWGHTFEVEMGEAGDSTSRVGGLRTPLFSLTFNHTVDHTNLRACLLVDGFSRLCF